MKKTILLLFLFSSSALSYERIVSTVPSLSEILFVLGLEKKVVGVSRFCSFSKSFCNKTKVGTAIDLEYEKIVSLKADAIVLSAGTSKSSIKNLEKLKIPVIPFRHNSLYDVMTSIKDMGRIFSKEKEAKILIKKINSQFKNAKKIIKNKKVLFVIGSIIKDSKISNAHVAGSHTFYNDILNELNLQNIQSDSTTAYPQLGRERLLMSKADIIFEIFGSFNKDKIEQKRKSWHELFSHLNRKVKYIPLYGDFLFLPGPRVGEIASEISKKVSEAYVKAQ
ncbi:hypothetical protein A9Q84_05715 [Halobacteriovorax marinus]|uniref:Fe/B12 periplasmic-binding domain-containing protein n=1 Tax=Halobacteriovorax marinus TaxID=97084 RepID=A0A1Y5FBM6_9BACT|nr:hypothetical protein A9Q84_05715 [Halobacteriovorax marinus]